MAVLRNINRIINQVASEVGLNKVPDVFASSDPAIQQMITLSNACGTELLSERAWERLNQEQVFITQEGDSGVYDLPEDFAYMVEQTAWDRTNENPLGGPLSEQMWQWVKSRNLVSSTIYAQFRLNEGKLWLYPQPPPVGVEIAYEYISNYWVRKDADPEHPTDELTELSDIPRFHHYLFERLLKLRFLEAKGFDTQASLDQYRAALEKWSARDKSSPILSAGMTSGGMTRLLDNCNMPDTGYGG